MKGTIVAMGASGVLMAAQSGASLLDQEYSAIDPTLSVTLQTAQKAISEGFSVWQIAVATICLPIAIKGLEIYKTHAQSKQEEKAAARERDKLRLEAELDAQRKREDRAHELEMARLQRGLPAIAQVVDMKQTS
jgi:hypothetical protein